MKVCSIAGCGKPVVARSWCWKHYQRWQRNGSPFCLVRLVKDNPLRVNDGRTREPKGYWRIKLQPDDFFFSMAGKQHYVMEHRLIMAKFLSRCLLPWEVVHHKGTKYPMGSYDDKGDNRLDNLQLLSSKKNHMPSILWQREMRKRDKRISQLEARITSLEAELVALQYNTRDSVKDYL